MSSPKVYFENLDALRFIAFVFIFLGHALDTESTAVMQTDAYALAKHYIYIFGTTGFSFAFVLSSYVNTWVILEERQRAGTFSPWRYYIRRALRIWPLYFLVLFIGFVVLPWFMQWMGEPYAEVGSPWYFLLFVGNFHLIEHGWTHSPIISVLWSVSVEEQFYIFWPFLLIVFRRHEKWLMALLMVAFAATTFYYYHTDVHLWFHTLFLLSDICMGAIFAFLSFHRNWGFDKLVRLSKPAIAVIYMVFFICLFFYRDIFQNETLAGPLLLIAEKLLFALLLSYFIFEQNFSPNSLFKFGRFKTLTWLGVVSYGLFCFHEIGLLIAGRALQWLSLGDDVAAFLLLKPIIAFLFILPLAHLSWNWFEKPFLQLKRHFYLKPLNNAD
jgi:peptidoglycan/LPS O-acetylase OafA/YrhL